MHALLFAQATGRMPRCSIVVSPTLSPVTPELQVTFIIAARKPIVKAVFMLKSSFLRQKAKFFMKEIRYRSDFSFFTTISRQASISRAVSR